MAQDRLKIGLALGSGGARGLAHIGVLKTLEENNIPIDYIAGVSSGSIAGAYYSLNGEIDSLEKKVLQLTKKDLLKLIDITSPKRALISGNKIKSFIGELISNKSFSDTKIPLRIIATDLCSGEEIQITEGRLVDAIRASISLPGIFSPAKLNGRLLLDGGIVNPTPVDVVKQMGADIVIGVDLTMKHPIKLENPTIVETLMQSFGILRTQATKLNVNNIKNVIIIRPNFSGVLDSYRFYENTRFIEEGKRVTKEVLPKIKDLMKR
ncbi:MAG: patatin-like phospholipase family protein [Nanoarchaeota archaeon]|nr:patatin-like phospholipase family protein [Nanoarchaeota archaeon]MCK5629612.1 patatin-like phospholipase family protein [Nanoarchaeota archaeon]